MRNLPKIFLLLSLVSIFAQNYSDVLLKYYSVKKEWSDTLDIQVGQVSEEFLLVDVREEKERRISFLPNSLSLKTFEERLGRDQIDAQQKILFYCTVGYRSGIYADKMSHKGFKAYNLLGGVLAWAQKGGEFHDSKNLPTDSVHVYSKDWNLLPKKGYQAVW